MVSSSENPLSKPYNNTHNCDNKVISASVSLPLSSQMLA